MTGIAYLVTMKAWTPEDVSTRLHELIGDGAEDDDRAQTRRRILDVATEHFVRFGYRKASIADIAQDAGLGKGTVYLYFDSKRTLISACVALEKLSLVPKFQAVMALPQEGRLLAYIQLSLRFIFEAPLSSAIVRGDRELKLLMDQFSKEERRDNEEKSIALLGSFVPADLGLGEAQIHDLMATLIAVLPLVSHLVDPDRRVGLDVDAFIEMYSRVLAQGILAEKPA